MTDAFRLRGECATGCGVVSFSPAPGPCQCSLRNLQRASAVASHPQQNFLLHRAWGLREVENHTGANLDIVEQMRVYLHVMILPTAKFPGRIQARM
jgi:hypothetical protein